METANLLRDLHFNGLQVFVVLFGDAVISDLLPWLAISDYVKTAAQAIDIIDELVTLVAASYDYRICIPRLSPCVGT